MYNLLFEPYQKNQDNQTINVNTPLDSSATVKM